MALMSDRYARVTFALLALLLVLRVAAVLASGLDLYADEAQYWRWSRTLDWGYYSKPPLIAWVIRATTELFGNEVWAIRLPAPFLHTVAAAALFFLGRAVYGSRAGLYAALTYALMPGVILSSMLLSTDGVLLPVFAVALYLYWRARQGVSGWIGHVALGLAIGIAMLAKYAALYLLIGIGLTALIDPPSRRAILSLKGAATFAVAALILAPHLAWNAANSFDTVSHTVDNANLGGPLFNLENLPKFLVDQMGIFGPVGFLTLLIGLVAFRHREPAGHRAADRWLLCFILPVLVIIAVQAVLSRAHANWAATAYPAASVLVAGWLIEARPNRALWLAIAAVTLLAVQLVPDLAVGFKIGLGFGIAAMLLAIGAWQRFQLSGLLIAAFILHGVLGLGGGALVASPPGVTAALGLDNALKRARGWEQTARALVRESERHGATALLVDEREIWHGIDYYARDTLQVPLISWRRNPGVKSFAERQPLSDDIDDRVLVASDRPGFRPRIRADFAQFEHVGTLIVPLGARANGCPIERRLELYLGSGYEPLPRNAAWEAQFEGVSEREPDPCPPLPEAAAGP